MKITAKCNSDRTVLSGGQKGFKQWILNWFLLVNLEMFIRTAIQLLDDLEVCQKTVGHLARDFYANGERKTQTRFRCWKDLEQYNIPHLLNIFSSLNKGLKKGKVFFFSVFQYKSHQHLNICSNSQRYLSLQSNVGYFNMNSCISHQIIVS